jgi:hypothetical protein
MLERKLNERDVLEALVSVIVSISLLDSKTKQGRLRGRPRLGTSWCCKRVNTIEKQ